MQRFTCLLCAFIFSMPAQAFQTPAYALQAGGAPSISGRAPISETRRKALEEMKAAGIGDPGANPAILNNAGYQALYRQNDVELAVQYFRWNVALFVGTPLAADLLDSLAESYVQAGDRASAIETYQQALAIIPRIPSDPNAANTLARLKADPKALPELQQELRAAYQ